LIDVAPGTLAVYSDPGCPWAHVAVQRLWRARAAAGLEDQVRFDIRMFPLELVNDRPTPYKALVLLEIPPLSELEPDAGWQTWKADPTTWPVTMLPAMEAIEAAKEQGLVASEHLDRALRRAFFGESRCISLRNVILDVAAGCGRVDADLLSEALDDGRARRAMFEAWWAAGDEVSGSAHVFCPDGTNAHNPGVEIHWEGSPGHRSLVIDRDEPAVYDELVLTAAGRSPDPAS
jgi:predicted DsbA family dithiol-disulfide isomerase